MISQDQNHFLKNAIAINQIDEKTARLIENIFIRKLELSEVDEIIITINKLSESNKNSILKAIFDTALSKNYPINKSTASKGAIGWANYIAQRFKNLRVFIKGSYAKEDTVKIVAEGDSWFEHAFITDIIDWIIRKTDMRVYPMAYGGDWIGNYLENPKFIQKIKDKRAEVFLISGGGNDLVGDVIHGGKEIPRLEILLQNVNMPKQSFEQNDIDELTKNPEHNYDVKMATSILKGRQFWNDDFYILFNIFRFQYLLILRLVELTNKEIKVIGHGYDFAIPNADKNNLFRKLLGHGRWLNRPMKNLGIPSEYYQDIINAMMHEFSNMLLNLTKLKDNFYFIDCRFAAKPHEWNDELHLHSHIYKKIALKFIECINDKSSTKVFRVNS